LWHYLLYNVAILVTLTTICFQVSLRMAINYILENIRDAASQVWLEQKAKKIWAFHGEMGAGKTTFIHSLCEILGLKTAITSPTYSIINEYEGTEVGTIFHMDWYRLKDTEEAVNAGVEDVLFSGNICFIEWPEKAAELLPEDTLHVYIRTVDTQTRSIEIAN
jgi:tRNA threonylcarbamoyladenosine biosynthesis protein TsaE